MKKWILVFTILAISVTACAQKSAPQQAESVEVAPTKAATSQVMIPIAGGAANESASVSPVAQPISPVATEPLKTEIGGDTVKNVTLSAETEKLVQLATEALTKMDSVQILAEDVVVKSVESREWRDASLGCPREGMMYAQVITSGYLIEMEAHGKVYEFHTNQSTAVVLCAVDGVAVK